MQAYNFLKMPATAGRVRMPANNRVHSSAALQTHGIWQSAIGYDPYAPNKEDNKKSSQPKASDAAAAEPAGENAYASFQGLLALARVTSNNVDESRGACKKCGRVGHLTFQCRNFLSIKDESNDKDSEAIQAAVISGLEKIKGSGRKLFGKSGVEDSNEDSDDESESSDSDYDSEIERAIAQSKKFGKKIVDKVKSSRKKNDDSDDDESDYERGKNKVGSKRSSSKRIYRDSDEDDKDNRKRREKRRRDESSDEDDDNQRQRRKSKKEKRRRGRSHTSDDDDDNQRQRRKSKKEKRRRRSHKHSDDSDGSEEHTRMRKRRSRRERSVSSPDVSSSDDSDLGGRIVKKQSGKRSRKHSHKRD